MAVVGNKTHITAFTVGVDYTSSQSVTNNNSTVQARLRFAVSSVGSIYVNARTVNITVGGTTKEVTMPAVNSDGGTVHYSSYATFTIPHNSDGAKSVAMQATYYVQVTINGTYRASWSTNSATVTLPDIARATTITSVGNITTASTGIAVNVSRKTSSFTHSMSLYIGSTFIADWTGSTANFTGSKTLALDATHRTRMLNAITTSTSATGKFTVRTYNGSATVGYASKNITISVDGEQVPRLSSANFSTVAETKYNLSGVTKSILAQHAGTLSYSVPWVMATGASVKNRSTTFGGTTRTASSGTFSTASSAASQNIVTKVTDSRGRTNSLTRAITVVPYSLVKLEVVYVGRPRNTNTAKHYLEVELYLTVHNFNSENKYRVRIQTKETGTSAWSTAHTVDYSGGTSRVKRTYMPSQIYDETKSYDVRIILEDELSSATSTGVLGTANYLMALGKYGVGFGKLPEGRRVLDVGGDIWDRMDRNLSETVSGLADFVNITGNFTLSEGVKSFYAYKLGRLRFFSFKYQPTKTGFTSSVILAASNDRPRTNTSVTVSTTQSTEDSARGISSYFSGILTVVTPEVPSYPMLFSCMYLV